MNAALPSAAKAGTPVVRSMQVVPVAGRDGMLLNLSGAHAPFFTRNLLILTDNAGRTGVARALAAETPVLCVGADVASAAAPHNRFLLGRVVATIAEGVATLPELRDGELAWTIAAALRAVDAPLPPPTTSGTARSAPKPRR